MPPAAVAGVGLAYQMYSDSKKRKEARQIWSDQNEARAAETQEQSRLAARNQANEDIYQGRYDNAQANVDRMDLQKIFGGEYAGLAGEMLPGKFQADALQGLMGVGGNVGGGYINASANRQFLDDQAGTEAAGASVSTLVSSLLDLADRDMGGQQAGAASSSYTPQSTVASTGVGVPTGLSDTF